jgi:tRNA-specific 2-thiouridylase
MKTGIIRTPEGEAIGEHDGVMYYTSGQRQGLCIGGRKGSTGEPWYVVSKDVASNELTVVQGKNHALLFTHNLYAADMHWVAGEAPASPCVCTAKNRYRQTTQDCVLTAQSDGRYLVEFEQPQRAVTAGQSVVFYLGQVCLGGGIIESAF